MDTATIRKYVRLYDAERCLFEEVGPQASRRGYLTFREFYAICIWKSARQKQNYLQNEGKKCVEDITKKAFSTEDEKEKIKLLCKLRGVKIRTASALLTVVFPNKYAVLDIRCLEMLEEQFRSGISKSVSLKTWLEYLSKMRSLASGYGITPRQLDMALFAMHKEKLENMNHRNLYQ